METYRANLTAAEFPFLTEFQGRTVIMPGIDQNFSRQTSSSKNKDRDVGIPQAYYMHNVMPTDAGLASVGYQQIVAAPADTDNTFQDNFLIRDPDENVAYFNNTSSGRNYVYLLGVGWVRTTDMAPAAGYRVTTAHVNGQTYIMFGRNACYIYDFGTNALVATPLTGLSEPDVIGICASNGYMIAWTETILSWSSTVDPTDFVPSLVTGAGGGGVQSAKAAISVVLPNNDGMICHTKRNAVALSYTGNGQYPFAYREVGGAGGLQDLSLSAFDGNSTNSYTYTSSGLQEISVTAAQIIFPQLTDFISGSQFEDYDETTFTFTQLSLSAPMVKRLAVIGNRYLVFSYGVTQLTHAIVYDFALGRWGKLKVTHVDCFEYVYPSSDVVDSQRKSIGFVQADGTIVVSTLSYDTTGSYGVVILGKYQWNRNRYIRMNELHLESVKAGVNLSVKLLSSINGLTTSTTTPVLAIDTGTYRRYNCNATGLNHSIALVGAFHFNSMELGFSDAGAVR